MNEQTVRKMRNVSVANKKIGNGSPAFIIAEAGLNHNGRLKLARDLIQNAAEIGADAVKFQTYITKKFVNQKSAVFKLFKKYELSFEEFAELSDFAKHLEIMFLSTPLDVESADFLDKIGVPAFKVASCDLTNMPFLKYLSEKGKPVILSTGMSDLSEVQDAVNVVRSAGNQDLVLLHCVSCYPASVMDVNLQVMRTLKEAFQVPVGFSDHTLSPLTSVVAVAMGASVIEKHFTLNKKLSGPDHKCSFDVLDFKGLISSIRQVEEMFGASVKVPVRSEIGSRDGSRRSITASRRIPKGVVITENLVISKVPGGGISPKDIASVVGRRTKVTIQRDELITWEKLD